MILTNIETVPGKSIHEHFGLVSGSTVRAKHVGKDIVALQLVVSPDLRLAAHAHAQQRFQRLVKPRDPALLPGCQRLVVNVRIADEQVLLEIHCTLSGPRCIV